MRTAIRTRKAKQNVISGSIEQVSVLNPTKELHQNGHRYTVYTNRTVDLGE